MDGFGKTTHANAMAAHSIYSSHSRYVAVPRNVVRIRALGFTLDVEGFHTPRNRTYNHLLFLFRFMAFPRNRRRH